MDPSSYHSIKPSGIPRLSRLPILRESANSVPRGDFSKSVARRPILPESFLGSSYLPDRPAKAPAQGETASISSAITKAFDETPGQSEKHSRAQTLPRRPRVSLSDRTIETLSQIPPSPSPRKRRDSLIPPVSADRSSRPTSSLSKSRPNTSHGRHPPLPDSFPTPRAVSPTKRPMVPSTTNHTLNGTPSTRTTSTYVLRNSSHHKADVDANIKHMPSNFRLKSEMKKGSKTLAARSSKSQPSAKDIFSQPTAGPRGEVETRKRDSSTLSKGSLDTFSVLSSTIERPSHTALRPAHEQTVPLQIADSPKTLKSSIALRETIAKAKAAHRKINNAQAKGFASPKLDIESFPKIEVGGSNDALLHKRITAARENGRLNISALGLKDIPRQVMNMYNNEGHDNAWYECVDLVRLVAADNEFEQLDDEKFPDTAVSEGNERDDYQGNLFAGLETLDLHGNRLRILPLGLRMLERLTTLNLSKNQLGNESLRVISEVVCLRELRLSNNALRGPLSSQIRHLNKLEVLDLCDNAIDYMPVDMEDLSCLRTLLIAGNRLSTLQSEVLLSLPLVELDVSRNRLGGTLFPASITQLSSLKMLDVSSNAISAIAEHNVVEFPSLEYLCVSENRLSTLPKISDSVRLFTLLASGNKLEAFPEGMSDLPHLKTVDFTRNDFKRIDENIGSMDSLTCVRLGNNPLRERRLLNMDTDELKHELRSRLTPQETEETAKLSDRDTSAITHHADDPRTMEWPLKAGGVLDRSSAKLENIDASDLQAVIQMNDVKNLILRHNILPCIPESISLLGHSLTNLDLSHNKCATSSYLTNRISLPALTVLDLSSNTITSVAPLLRLLSAPRLSDLDISRNHLQDLPPLHTSFPMLSSLSVSYNRITQLEVESVRGLQTVDVSGNAISHLEPRLGLLETEGLRTLVVGGNTFRVPRSDVVNKGTQAILAWLRGRIPEQEI